jgi:hypothetical protein
VSQIQRSKQFLPRLNIPSHLHSLYLDTDTLGLPKIACLVSHIVIRGNQSWQLADPRGTMCSGIGCIKVKCDASKAVLNGRNAVDRTGRVSLP